MFVSERSRGSRWFHQVTQLVSWDELTFKHNRGFSVDLIMAHQILTGSFRVECFVPASISKFLQ